MNDSMTAHQFKIKEPNGWSTHCRTDDTLAADGVSHSDSLPPPATRGFHPPTETLSQPYTQYSILDTLVFHFCTFAQAGGRFAPLHGFFASLVNVSTCPRAPSRKRVSPCQPVPSRKRCPLATFGRVEVQPSKGTA